MKKVTIIIPILNGEKYIKKCFDSIFSQTFREFEVVVFDNGSSDKSVEILSNYKDVKIIKNGINIGWSKANNHCIKACNSKYVLLLNVDTILKEDCIEKLYLYAEKNQHVAMISPAIIEYRDYLEGRMSFGYPLSFDLSTGLIRAYQPKEEATEVSFVPGTALFANKEILGNILYFREDFFMYHEDVELSLRVLTSTNFKLFFLKTALVAHDSKQSFGKASTCWLAVKNLFFCLRKYQTTKEYLFNIRRYLANLVVKYFSFYKKYYPLTYPLVSIYCVFFYTFLFKGQEFLNTSRLRKINLKLSLCLKESFNFIF